MSNVKVISHFVTNSETERRQNFNALTKMMVYLALGSDIKRKMPEREPVKSK